MSWTYKLGLTYTTLEYFISERVLPLMRRLLLHFAIDFVFHLPVRGLPMSKISI